MDRTYSVYLLTNRPRGVFYVGVTSDLVGRVWEHRNGVTRGFVLKYGLNRLVWWTDFGDVRLAIEHEKRVKRWRRTWKIELVERGNPDWIDLYPQIESPLH